MSFFSPIPQSAQADFAPLLPAVVPEVAGRGYIIGFSQWTVDPEDPVGEGFFLR